jgi:hypothetical protein
MAAFISVIAALYPNEAIQMNYIVSQMSVFESNMNIRKTNLKNPGKLGQGKTVDVATESKSGSCGSVRIAWVGWRNSCDSHLPAANRLAENMVVT